MVGILVSFQHQAHSAASFCRSHGSICSISCSTGTAPLCRSHGSISCSTGTAPLCRVSITPSCTTVLVLLSSPRLYLPLKRQHGAHCCNWRLACVWTGNALVGLPSRYCQQRLALSTSMRVPLHLGFATLNVPYAAYPSFSIPGVLVAIIRKCQDSCSSSNFRYALYVRACVRPGGHLAGTNVSGIPPASVSTRQQVGDELVERGTRAAEIADFRMLGTGICLVPTPYHHHHHHAHTHARALTHTHTHLHTYMCMYSLSHTVCVCVCMCAPLLLSLPFSLTQTHSLSHTLSLSNVGMV